MQNQEHFHLLVTEMLDGTNPRQLELSRGDLLFLGQMHDRILQAENTTEDLEYSERFLMKHGELCNSLHYLLAGVPKLSQPGQNHPEMTIRVLLRVVIENAVQYLWLFQREHSARDRKLILLWMELCAIHQDKFTIHGAKPYYDKHFQWLRKAENWSRLEEIKGATINTKSTTPLGSPKTFDMKYYFEQLSLYGSRIHSDYIDYSDIVHTNGRTLSMIKNIVTQPANVETLRRRVFQLLYMLNSAIIMAISTGHAHWQLAFNALPMTQQDYYRMGNALFYNNPPNSEENTLK